MFALILFFFSVHRWDRRYRVQQQQPVGLRRSLVGPVTEVSWIGGQRRRFEVHVAFDFKLRRQNCYCIGKSRPKNLKLKTRTTDEFFNAPVLHFKAVILNMCEVEHLVE